ncbi:hypothetical protein L210DRAFT_3516338, partial [Boletus edulis BED1]
LRLPALTGLCTLATEHQVASTRRAVWIRWVWGLMLVIVAWSDDLVLVDSARSSPTRSSCCEKGNVTDNGLLAFAKAVP